MTAHLESDRDHSCTLDADRLLRSSNHLNLCLIAPGLSSVGIAYFNDPADIHVWLVHGYGLSFILLTWSLIAYSPPESDISP